MIFLNNINRPVRPARLAIDESGVVRSRIAHFRRLLFILCWWIAAVTVVLQARPAWAEVFYAVNDTGIYSVDTVSGGPSTLLVAAPPLPGGTANSYVTLAVRPSDGLLFFLDRQGANPTLRSWDPANPALPFVVIGTLGVGVSGVIRLGFDAAGNLYASNGGSPASIWRLDPATGAIISTVPQSGAVTTAGSGDVCLQPGTGTLFTVAGTSLLTTDPVTGVNTLLGTMLVGGTAALPGNATGCAFDSAGRLVISQIGSSQLYAVNIGTRVATALTSTAGQVFLDLATGPSRTADLRVSKAATNITPANAVTFAVTVTNDGPDRATDVRLVDVLPAGLTFVSATASQGAYSTAAVAPNPAGTWRVGTLNNGASATLTITATVAGATNTAINTAQVYYVDQRDPDSAPNNSNVAEDDQASVTINRSPDLQVVKSTPSSFAVGVNGTYTLTVNNLIGSLATSGNYTVVDPMPPGLTIVGTPAGTGWNCAASTATQLSCTSSTVIAAGAGNPNAITFTVAVAAAAFPSVTNVTTVSGGGELNLPNFTGNNSHTLITPVCAATCPDLRPNKSLTAPSITSLTVGTNSTYTLSVTNIGGLTTGAVAYTLTDTLPTGLTLAAVPAVGVAWSCPANTPSAGDNVAGGSRVVCTSTTALVPGATSTNVVIQVAVANTAVPSVTNTATVSGGGDPNTGNNTVNLTHPVIDFDLTVTKTKTVAGNFVLGVNTATYTIVVNNIGGRASTGTYTVTDVLPAGLTLNAAPTVGAGWTCAANTPSAGDNVAGGGRVVCTNATAIAAAGTSTTIVFPVRVGSGVGSSVSNTATVGNPNESPNLLTNNASTVSTPVDAPDLIVTKTHTGNFTVGQTGIYSITVFNTGAQNSSGTVTVTDTLPAGLTYTSTSGNATGTGWTCNAAPLSPATTQTITCTIATAINAGTSAAPITLPVTATAAGTLINNVSVSGGNEPAGNAGNNTDADSTAVFFAPVIAKAFTPASIGAGGVSTLTLTISNPASNGVSLNGLTVVDPFPSGMTVAATPAFSNTCGGTVSPGNVTGNTVISLTGGGTVAPGASCVISVNVTTASTGAFVNTTGQVSSSNSGIGNAATATLTVLAPPTVTKSFAAANIVAGGATTMTIALANANGAANPITGVAFTDNYPADLLNTASPVVSNTCGGTLTAPANGSSVALSGGTIPSTGCTIVVNVTSSVPGPMVNTIPAGGVTTANAGASTAAASATLRALTPPTITKSFSPNAIGVDAGDFSTMTIVVSNPAANGINLTGVNFSDPYPQNVGGVGAADMVNAPTPTPTNACTAGSTLGTLSGIAAGNTTLGWTGATIAPGGSCTITIRVRGNAAATYVNTTGNVAATGPIALTGTNASATLAVGRPGITKSFATSPIVSGGTSVMTITLINGTSAPMTAAAFTDTYPAGMTNAAVPAAATTCGGTVIAAVNGPSVALSSGTIPANSTCTVTVTVTATLTATNTIAIGALSTSAGTNATAASAILIVLGPPTVVKTVTVISDPVNGTTNPKAIPGAIVEYSLIVTNFAVALTADSVVVSDVLNTNTALVVTDIAGAGSGPVQFQQGATASGLTYTYANAASNTDDLEFFNSGGTRITVLTPNANGCDANVARIQVNPKGVFASGASPPQPSFVLRFRACIK